MGKTAFSGPVFGAKQTLHTVRLQDVSSGGGNGIDTNVTAVIVPAGEVWLATEWDVYRGSTGSSAFGASVLANSTVLSSVTFTSTTAGAHTQNILTADAGEYAGVQIASGSTVFFKIAQTSVVGASSNITLTLSGYRRFVSSTRAE